ncbi:spermatogenesis associated 6-like protein isoform X2 [Chionomys nivalis]|nr:spermatogenesis associated 6-like protein isoform X2 [Chionomys nivalis]XP_057634799.1 spermatogenesis associated 6-like protein isoform X2 [Chionomys nivalis]
MIFEKVFENAIDPGAVAEILEIVLWCPRDNGSRTSHTYQSTLVPKDRFLTRFELIQLVSPAWEELAYYEENTRDFLFPEPKLTSSHLGMYREVLMKTPIGFPGIAPKLEFSTRTAIRECVFPHRNRFFEENCKPQKPLSKSHGQRTPTNNRRMKQKEKSPDRLPKGTQARVPSPSSPRCLFQHQPTQQNLGKSFRLPETRKPPFVVRHVDSENPFGESSLEHHLPKSRRKKSKFLDFALPMRRASSLESLEANVKVTREPDERIVLRSQTSPPLDPRKSGQPSPSHQGDVELLLDTSLPISQHSRSPSPLDEPLFRERFHPRSQSTWRKIHERVCSLLTSHRAHSKEDFIPETNYICERPSYPLKKLPLHEQRYF